MPVSYDAFTAPVYLAKRDFNHDGWDDFVVPNSYAQTSMSVIMSDGHGGFEPPHTLGIAETGNEVEVGDFNHDGNEDFAVRGANEYMVHYGKGDGTFYPEVDFATANGAFERGTHGDFNGDGAVDFAYANTAGGVTVVSNDNADQTNLAGAVSFQLTAPATTTSGSVLPMTVSALDANGNVATGFRGTVFISSSDPAATTAAGYAFNPVDAGIAYTFTAADAGTHTFTGPIRLVTGGFQTVTAAAPFMTPATVTVAVTGKVSNLAFSAPSATNAGDSFNITVSAVDVLGVVNTAYTSTVHFSSSDSLAGLPADYTFTAADAGTQSITVKDVATSALVGSQTGIVVSPAAAAQFVFSVPASVTQGVGFKFTVTVPDAYGNVATNYRGKVHLSSTDGRAGTQDYTFSSNDNGVHTFSYTLNALGSQTLTLIDTSNSSLVGSVLVNVVAKK